MKNVDPLYIKLLIAALVIWIIGISFYTAETIYRVGEIEHQLAHMPYVKCQR